MAVSRQGKIQARERTARDGEELSYLVRKITAPDLEVASPSEVPSHKNSVEDDTNK